MLERLAQRQARNDAANVTSLADHVKAAATKQQDANNDDEADEVSRHDLEDAGRRELENLRQELERFSARDADHLAGGGGAAEVGAQAENEGTTAWWSLASARLYCFHALCVLCVYVCVCVCVCVTVIVCVCVCRAFTLVGLCISIDRAVSFICSTLLALLRVCC